MSLASYSPASKSIYLVMAIDDNHHAKRKNPNFMLILVLACVFLLLALLSAFFTIDWEGKRLIPRAAGKQNHPTSQLLHENIQVQAPCGRLA